MPKGERFYYRQKDKVIDGTKCDNERADVCLDGKCLVIFYFIIFFVIKIIFYVNN